MNANGSNLRNLSNNDAVDWFSDWSPDGTQIAFMSFRDGNDEICDG
jgi:TolB protein